MMSKINKVLHRDWMENGLPDSSVDMIIADPPYFKIKGDFDFHWRDLEHYLDEVRVWAEECARVLKKRGTLFWYGHAKIIAYVQVVFDEHFKLINSLVWDKGDKFMGLTHSEDLRSFPPCTERILMYSNDTYNLTECVKHSRDYIRAEIARAKGRVNLKEINGVLGTATNGGGVASSCLSLSKGEPNMMTEEHYNTLREWLNDGGGEYLGRPYEYLKTEYEELRAKYDETRRPFVNMFKLQEVLRFSNEQGRVGSKYDHETVKPETLTRALILTCSRPDDLILVPFAGSGTECAMAVKEGRRFIGFDISEKYTKLANGRVWPHIQQFNLFTHD